MQLGMKQGSVGGVANADPDHGRARRPEASQHGEILILGEDGGSLSFGMVPDGGVRRATQARFAHMLGSMAAVPQQPAQGGRQLGVDEEPRHALRSTGWSACLAANCRVATMSSASR